MNTDFKFYLRRIDIQSKEIDVEEEFPGLHYLSISGLNTIGKAKNVYTEDYPEADSLRVYVPQKTSVKNASTSVTLVVLITGNKSQRNYILSSFTNYISNGVFRYRDNVRDCMFDFIVEDEIKASDERFYGDNPYIEVTLKLKNINGKALFK